MKIHKSKAKNTARSRLGSFVSGLMFLLAGLLILLALFLSNNRQQSFASTAQSADGTVIEIIERNTYEHGLAYAPKIQFLTKNEQLYTFTSSYSFPASYSIGDTVSVLYDPQMPQNAVIAADNSFLTNPFMIGFAVMGLIMSAAGIYNMLSVFAPRRKKAA